MKGSIMRSRKKSKSFCKQMKMNTQAQNLWDKRKAILRWKFISIQAYIKKIEIFQINDLTLDL